MALQPLECSLIGLCEKSCHLALLFLRAIEPRSALNEREIAVRNRQKPERRNIVRDGQSALDHFVGPAMSHVGKRQQLLTHARAALHAKVADTADLVAAQAGFDVAIGHSGKPLGQGVEIANKVPDLFDRRADHARHVNSHHVTPPVGFSASSYWAAENQAHCTWKRRTPVITNLQLPSAGSTCELLRRACPELASGHD